MTVLDRLAAPFSARARLRVGLDLVERGKGAKGFHYLARAAVCGCTEAQYRVARCYLDGKAVPQSGTEAMRWLERAARRGHSEAQFVLAALYAQGLGGGTDSSSAVAPLFPRPEASEPNYEAALHWGRLAAEGGNAEAQALLGYVLTSGPMTLRDAGEAENWYRRSARAGCPQGSLGLGLALLRTARDEAGQREAAGELRKAATAGLGTALYLLGA